ncbi:hypothetical protein N8K70_07190 [Microbacterium betulae]|uniref:Integral membrane protein n=1 Tax=Microbacterium betulae TaxID=2981139 RepID=A0AA97FJJ4_9MICO|nr:hypothetical protein [Microbacterium sp. AB]WOF24443.1 hypothetical protein N8K70_07190 [Microbacterium sp. AB]
MADGRLTASSATTGWRARWDALPPVVRITSIYVAARLVTTALMLLSAQLSPASSRFGPDPGLVDYILGWDAQWYWTVAVDGYPADLPLSEGGDVEQNAWAFMPVYAYLSQLVGNVLGAGTWWIGALLVSLVAGWAACVVLHRLLRERLDEDRAQWGVVIFASGPLAALFQVGYAESLFLLFLLTALLCVMRRRWRALYLLVPLMGFTRPGVLAFALFLGLYGIWRLTRRRTVPLPRIEIVHIVAVAALATAVGFAWQAITGAVTGDPEAYLETELAWRRSWTGDGGGFVPFEGWIQAAGVWAGVWGIPAWLCYALLGVGVAGTFAALLFASSVRRLGGEVRLWSASYLVYLLAVFFPQSSTFRLLVPLAPLAGALAVTRRPGYRACVLLACLVAQWAWIFGMYGHGNTFWLIP